MKDRSVLAGSLLAGLLASACCIGPLVLGVLGLGSLGLGAALEPYRPWFLGVTAVFLAIGFYLAYRPRPEASCAPGEACATRPAGRRNQRLILWIVTALTIGVATYPNWGAAISRPSAANAVAVPASVVTLDVTGMSCSACAVSIEKELRAVPGVSDAQVDFEKAKATVQLNSSHPDLQILVAAVEKAGYHATPATQ
ncbi:MAG: cation transporter [Candidatus Latescibacteria bacterium]|nr:cation transporter [Candidatus Latescibacterota bacterium]